MMRTPGIGDTAKAGQAIGCHLAIWSQIAARPLGNRLAGEARIGRGSLHLARVSAAPRWARREAYRSPRYTTRWDELPVARA
jgi:hypothetical protein